MVCDPQKTIVDSIDQTSGPRCPGVTGSLLLRVRFFTWIALAVLLCLAFSAALSLHSFGPVKHSVPAAHASRPPLTTDRFGDGTPDFLRLNDPADQSTFRRWFTLIAEYQAIRPKPRFLPEITDCASLLRYAYREALKRHDESWFDATGIRVAAPPGEIRAWSYPHTPLGAGLFRVRPGAFVPADVSDGAFAQFADARTLVERNAYLCEPRCARRHCRAICSFIGSSGSPRRGTR